MSHGQLSGQLEYVYIPLWKLAQLPRSVPLHAMGNQGEAPPAFCASPPSCLVLLSDEKVDSEQVRNVFMDEARELQSRLREQLSQVKAELGVFLRLMYKNKNQHRRSLYYRRLSEVRRDLQMLVTLGLDATVENFTKFFSTKRRDGVFSKAAAQFEIKDAMDESKALCTLLGVARLLNRINGPIMEGSAQLAGLLGQSFFMPFALTMLSCLARFRVLLIQVLYEVVTAFNLLSEVWQRKQKVQFLLHYRDLQEVSLAYPVSASFLGQRLAVQLKCQWDGVKLCMTEKKRVCILESGGRDSDILAEPTPQWFVDDRTGVKYDFRVPAAVAGSAGEELHVNFPATLNLNKGMMGMVHEVEKPLRIEPNVHMCRLDSEEDISTPSGDSFVAVVDNAELRDLSDQGPDSFTRNATCKQASVTGSTIKKSVAYISVSHKFALKSTAEAQNLQSDAKEEGADIGVKQEVKDKEVNVLGYNNNTRYSGDRGMEPLFDNSLIGNRPTVLPQSFSSSCMDMVASELSKQELEQSQKNQEIADGPIQNTWSVCYGDEPYLLDENNRNNQVQPHQDNSIEGDATASAFRVVEKTDKKDDLKASVKHAAVVELQMGSNDFRTTLDHGVENHDGDFMAVDILSKGSMMTLEQVGADGNGSAGIEGPKRNKATMDSSQNSAVDQIGSIDMLINRPVSDPLKQKLNYSDMLSFQNNTEGAVLASCSLRGMDDLERTPNQVGDVKEGTSVQKDIGSTYLDRSVANLCVLPNPVIAVEETGPGPVTVQIQDEVCCTTSGLSSAVGSKTESMKDNSLRKPGAHVPINPGLDLSWEGDKPVAASEDYWKAGCDHTLPKNVELERAAEQSWSNLARNTTRINSQGAKNRVKRPVAYVSVGPDVRSPQKWRKGGTERKTGILGKGGSSISPENGPTENGASRENGNSKDTSCKRESKNKKADDIFAMLLGGSG